MIVFFVKEGEEVGCLLLLLLLLLLKG